VPFGGDAKLAQAIKDVVVGDLLRSGLFRMVDPEGAIRTRPMKSATRIGRGAARKRCLLAQSLSKTMGA